MLDHFTVISPGSKKRSALANHCRFPGHDIRFFLTFEISGWLNEQATRGTTIKVLSYNIQAPSLILDPHLKGLYADSDDKYISWEYRSQALMRELAEFDADVSFSI